MAVIPQYQGYLIIVLFALAMIGITYVVSRDPRWKHTGLGFLVAKRDVPKGVGAASIAASWIWAPALFVSVQKSYELGLPGLLWFTVPNVLALVIFAWLAPRIRQKLPGGYTLPDWINYRFESKSLHRVYLIPYIWYQVMAVTVQIFVGGLMLNFLTGIPLNIVMVLLLATGLSYSLISGLRASVVTDFIQMAFILVGLAIVIPWVLSVAGIDAVAKGLGGMIGTTNVFDPRVAISFGVVTSIGLIAGAISDQQYWQRSFAIRQRDLVPAFVWGGIMFGIVPLALSVLGFLAANPDMNIPVPAGTGLPMIGISTVVTLLPTAAAIFFVIMLLAGLASTLDSALCAASSLYSIDMAPLTERERQLLRKESTGNDLIEEERAARAALDEKITRRARTGMYGIAALGLLTAFIVQHLFSLDRLWWIFNGIASMFVVPTILSVFWDRLSARGVLYSIAGASVAMVAFIYGNWVTNDTITVASAVAIVVISLAMCLAFPRATPWVDPTQTETPIPEKAVGGIVVS
jgi:urea-proton symporter